MKTNILYCADSYNKLKKLPENSIDLVVCSPPYDKLRKYEDKEDWSFNKFTTIANQLYRIMKKGGVIVWVVGDAVVNKSETGSAFKQALYFKDIGFKIHDTMIYKKSGAAYPASKKDNRYTQCFEYMFVLSKEAPPKTANLIADRKNRWGGTTNWGKRRERKQNGELKLTQDIMTNQYGVRYNIWKYDTGKNRSTKDDVAFKHPAIFPEKLAKDHILTWSNPNDIVLDPFLGSGTVVKMCNILDRQWIGIDYNQKYIDIAYARLSKNESKYRKEIEDEGIKRDVKKNIFKDVL